GDVGDRRDVIPVDAVPHAERQFEPEQREIISLKHRGLLQVVEWPIVERGRAGRSRRILHCIALQQSGPSTPRYGGRTSVDQLRRAQSRQRPRSERWAVSTAKP